MRETFPREAAANPEPFTGERLTGCVHGQVELEHYHRYLFTRGFCFDRDVLDVASGEGYGAAQMAQVARYVIGVEYNGATVRNAGANFPRDNLTFVQADARGLPLREGSVDVVTSFETIEHFDRQDDFVAEVRRVLRSDGCFIVSTPDRDVYSPPGAPANPFHVREFDRGEFLDLLHRHFRYVSLVRQRPLVASSLLPEEPAAVLPLIFERDGEAGFAMDRTLPKAPYLIAIASEMTPRLAPASLLIDHSDLDNVRFGEQEVELTRLRAAEADARAAAQAAREAAQRAEDDARAAAQTLQHTRAALVQANNELDRISGSARHFLMQYIPRLWHLLAR